MSGKGEEGGRGHKKRGATNTNDSSLPKQYARTGDGIGKSASVDGNKNSALHYFNIFLASKKMPSHSNLKEFDVTIELMQELGTFFSFDALMDNDEPLSLGAARTQVLTRI